MQNVFKLLLFAIIISVVYILMILYLYLILIGDCLFNNFVSTNCVVWILQENKIKMFSPNSLSLKWKPIMLLMVLSSS